MTDAQLIDMLGRPAKVAKLCGVTVQAVCQWRNNNAIPAAPLMIRFLKPNVFGVLTFVNTPVDGVVAPTLPLREPANPGAVKTPVDGKNDTAEVVETVGV